MTIPILMYHEVSPHSWAGFRKYVVSPTAFVAQMRWLQRAGYHPIRLDALLAAWTAGAQLPSSAVVITFDDGYRDCVRYASEILQRHAFPAVFFIVAGMVGQTSRWLMRERGIELPLAEWASLRRLVAAGFECGAHSLTHPRLASLPPDTCRYELEASRQILEEGLGRKVVHLAYPFGSFNVEVRESAANAGYRTACTVERGLATAGDDVLALRRVPVVGEDTLLDFVCRVRTGRSVRELGRDFVQKWRPLYRNIS